MDVQIKNVDDVTVVALEGELDGKTAPVAQSEVLPLAQPGCKLLLDMSKVPYMSSAGLRMMLLIYRQVSANDGQSVLVGLSEEIKDTMEVTGFLDYFEVCDTYEAGLEALNG
jgi:anti-sigma B factor antagonist